MDIDFKKFNTIPEGLSTAIINLCIYEQIGKHKNTIPWYTKDIYHISTNEKFPLVLITEDEKEAILIHESISHKEFVAFAKKLEFIKKLKG